MTDFQNLLKRLVESDVPHEAPAGAETESPPAAKRAPRSPLGKVEDPGEVIQQYLAMHTAEFQKLQAVVSQSLGQLEQILGVTQDYAAGRPDFVQGLKQVSAVKRAVPAAGDRNKLNALRAQWDAGTQEGI
jgi:hypothetical protein